jgi:hypothetical protein
VDLDLKRQASEASSKLTNAWVDARTITPSLLRSFRLLSTILGRFLIIMSLFGDNRYRESMSSDPAKESASAVVVG